MASYYLNVSSKTVFDRSNLQLFQSPDNYNLPSSVGATGRDKISICALVIHY